MRRMSTRATLALLCAVACTPEPAAPREAPPPAPTPASQPLAIPGLTVDVPGDFVPLEPERRKLLRDAAGSGFVDADLTLEGKRAPVVAQGIVYVQRSESPRDITVRPTTVRQLLENFTADFKATLLAAGNELPDFAFAEQSGGLEGCFTGRSSKGDRIVVLRACMRITITAEQRGRYLLVGCMTDNWNADACDPILATRRFDAAPSLPLDEVLPANAPPPVPLPGVTATRIGDIVLGQTRAEFVAACRKSGHTVDAVDWSTQPPEIQPLFAAGVLAQCSDLPQPRGAPRFELGEVTRARGLFIEGKLAVVGLELAPELERVEQRLAAAYPDLQLALPAIHHVIDDAATGDQLHHVDILEAASPGARTAVHFTSARGATTPALPVVSQ